MAQFEDKFMEVQVSMISLAMKSSRKSVYLLHF